jgi:general stress protein YciG
MEENTQHLSVFSEPDYRKKKRARRISGSKQIAHGTNYENISEEMTKADPLAEARKKGGDACLEKYGTEHYRVLGKKGGTTTKQRHDPEYYRRIGALGREARRKKKLERQEHALASPPTMLTEKENT